MSKTRGPVYNIGKCDWEYQARLRFCQAQYMGVGSIAAHPTKEK